MANIKIRHLCLFSSVIFTILLQASGQNPNPNAAASSCGGVLELSSGVLELDFTKTDPNGQDFCMWVIKLPVTSYNIRFQLTQIPEASQLNLYSQEGHVAGQFSILPIATLTSADTQNSTTEIADSNLIVIWTPSRVQNEKEDDGALLSFKWDRKYEEYSFFSISDASDFYRLTLSGSSGTANDSMSSDWSKNGQQFSTQDKDNDADPEANCAEYYASGGWWYSNDFGSYCGGARLNGLYHEKGESVQVGDGIIWYSWAEGEAGWFSLAKTELKTRARKIST